ncbi:MAG: peroxiredoxin [Candidatus Sumerlaeia bacterium]|nr:peroxiredoxin [Candidatus Sumerlaeia bacterium]
MLFRIFPILAVLVIVSACSRPAAATEEGEPEQNPSTILSVGSEAPNFTVSDDEGNTVSLADFRGDRNVVLIFYPANETPGCTRQLCAARDAWDEYIERNIQVFGVNPASIADHKSFRNNHQFPFPLLADTDGEVVAKYGARGLMGLTKRTVYGINAEGRIVFAERGMPDTKTIVAAFDS